MNLVVLIGYLGKDPELRYTTSGLAVANFSMATSERWKDADGQPQEKTEWHNIVAWRKLAEICGEHLKKGSRVMISGKLQTRSYDDRNTGSKRYITEIVADKLEFLSPSSGGGRRTDEEEVTEKPEASNTLFDLDLPF